MSVWKTKDLNMRGTDITNINFANLGNQAKYIDTIKYHEQSLAHLTQTITSEEEEKIAVKKSQVICQHNYFRQDLDGSTEEKLLQLIAAGKSVNIYEKIPNFDSLDSTQKITIFLARQYFIAS